MATTAIPKTKILGGGFLLEERQTAEVFTPEDFTDQHQMIGPAGQDSQVLGGIVAGEGDAIDRQIPMDSRAGNRGGETGSIAAIGHD